MFWLLRVSTHTSISIFVISSKIGFVQRGHHSHVTCLSRMCCCRIADSKGFRYLRIFEGITPRKSQCEFSEAKELGNMSLIFVKSNIPVDLSGDICFTQTPDSASSVYEVSLESTKSTVSPSAMLPFSLPSM